MTKKTSIGFIAAVAMSTLSLAPGASAEEVSLRAADSFPTGHYIAENTLKIFMEQVTEMTNGDVSFEYFPAQQLGKAKDMLSLTKDGVTDIGYVGPSYVSDKMPLSSVGELPEAFTNSCGGTLAYWEIAKPGGPLDAAEFEPNGVRLLMAMVLPPYNVVTTDRELTGFESLKNLKVRSSGGAKEIAVLKFGAVPVQMPAPEVREALSRGTIDAGLFPYSSILAYNMEPFLKYGTQDINFGSFVATYVISIDRWNALPANVQEAMTKAGEAVTRSGCAVADRMNGESKQELAESGVVFKDFPDADVAKLNEMLGGVGAEWAAALDARDKPGTDILNAFRAALAAQSN